MTEDWKPFARLRSCLARPTAAILLASCLCFGTAARGENYLYQMGGSGGSSFKEKCAQGEVLVGLALRTNNALRSIAMICGKPVNPFSIDEESVWLYPNWYGTVQAPGRVLRCSDGEPVIRGLHVGGHHSLDLVDEVGLLCGPSSPDAPPVAADKKPAPHWWGGDSPGLFSAFRGVGDFACGHGEVAVGIAGRSGASVDALGLICELASVATAGATKPYAPLPNSDRARSMLGGPAGLPKNTDASVLLKGLSSVGTPAAPSPTPPIALEITTMQGTTTIRAILTWRSATAATVDVYRNGALVQTTPNDGRWVNPIERPGTYIYKVCHSGSLQICSNEASVTV